MWQQVFDMLGGNLLGGVKDLIQTFKLPPEQQLAFDQRMAELHTETQLKLADLEATDRDSARKRQMEVKDSTNTVLAYWYTAGYFAVLALVAFYGIPETQQRIFDVLLGVLSAAQMNIMTYYFGSSAGSAAKHAMIDRMTK